MPNLDQIVKSSERPLVSVIMPHWRTLPYIKEAMVSIAYQTFLRQEDDLELIIIDDGSPQPEYSRLHDMFHSTIYNWAKPFSRVLDTIPHGGKNRAIEYAKRYIDERSRYTFVADSDDIFAPEFVQNLFDALEEARARDPKVVMAYCDSILIDRIGLCVGTATAPDFDRALYFGTDRVEGSNFIPGNALVVTERFLAGVPKDLDAVDRDKWLRHTAELGYDGTAIHVKDVQNEPRRDYFYRQRDGQISGHGKKLEEKEFFAPWPAGVSKPHWRQWVALTRPQQLELLRIMPNIDTDLWNHYLPQPAR